MVRLNEFLHPRVISQRNDAGARIAVATRTTIKVTYARCATLRDTTLTGALRGVH